MEITLLDPVKIWAKKIAVSEVAGVPICAMLDMLRDRSVSILRRKRGLMRNASSLVQHFNPACRAARAYPELPIARLLMSLSDYDIPVKKPKNSASYLTYAYDAMMIFCIGILGFLVIMPEFLMDGVLENGAKG